MKSYIALLLALLCILPVLSACKAGDVSSVPSDSSNAAEETAPTASETQRFDTSSESEALSDRVPEDVTTESATETEAVSGSVQETACQITSFTVPADKNKNMYESIVGEISGDVITLNITAPTDSFSLCEAKVDVVTDAESYYFSNGSSASVDLTSPDGCYCTIADSNGNERTYSVVTVYADHTIPVISINTLSGEEVTSKEDYTDAVISIDISGVDGWYLPDGIAPLEPTDVQIRGGGNSTWNWPKKPYKLKFDSKTEVLGLEKAKKWILLANYSDYSLMRNYVAFEASRVISDDLSPLSQFPVNLFFNGEYQGVYSIGEDHEVNDGRVELAEDNGDADTSFMLEVGGAEEDDVLGSTAFHSSLIKFCSIEYPEDEDLTREQADFIIDYVKKADAAVVSLDGYEDYIDVDSVIDWFITNELFYNLESCFRRSCFLTKEQGGKLKMGPVWDFDLAVGNLYDDYGLYESWACLTQEYGYIEDNWFCYLLTDEEFKSRLKSRWDEVKDELLEKILYCIDNMESTLAPNAKYNFEVWDIMGTRAVAPQPLSITSLLTYESHVKYIRDFLLNRWTWMDNNI